MPAETEPPAVAESLRGSPLDHSRIKVVGGVIHYRIYQQDGSMQAMTAPDTQGNRQIVSWIQIHDRY